MMQVRKEHEIYGNQDHAPNDRWLYHYTTFEAFTQIAKSRSFRLSRFDGMNDPREFEQLRSWNITRNPDLLNQIVFAKKYSYVSCFSSDSYLGEKSVRRGYEISPMWASYGGNHSGVCLIFDKEKLIDAFSRAFSKTSKISYGRISYDSERSNLSLDTDKAKSIPEGDIETSAIKFLEENWWYLKDPDWQYEREFRFTVGADHSITSSFINFALEDSVVSVCCGSKFATHLANRTLLKDSAASLGVSWPNIKLISWHNNRALTMPIGSTCQDERCLVRSAINKTGLPLPIFAERIKTPTEEVIDWKEGRSVIPGTASILLKFICSQPEIINEYAFAATPTYGMDKTIITDKESLINHVNQGQRVFYLHFWGHSQNGDAIDESCFSQWFPACFTLDDITYPTTEHYMMAQKARLFNDDEKLGAILSCQHPSEAKTYGREVNNFDPIIWNDHCFDYVVSGNIAKFDQNPDLKKFLLDTQEKVLVEASPYDKIWGIGMTSSDPSAFNPKKWAGKNLLGFALMVARQELAQQIR